VILAAFPAANTNFENSGIAGLYPLRGLGKFFESKRQGRDRKN